MRAVVCDRYGPPDSLRLEEVARPSPKGDQVLVKVHAASLNAADLEILSGTAFARFSGPFRPRDRIPGSDMAGRVVAVGAKARRFKEGDDVFGDLFSCGRGAFAEYVAVPERALMLKPAGISFEHAATLPQAARIALQALRGRRPLTKGQKVLVNGAGGGMGTFAVQIAKYFEAEVTAVDRASKLDMLRSIGADHVIDFTKEDFAEGETQYDLIINAVTQRSIFNYRQVMARDGIFVLLGGSRYAILQAMLLGPFVSLAGKKMGTNPIWVDNEGDLRFLLELVENGKIRPVIGRQVSLEEIPKALEQLTEGNVMGKIVLCFDRD